MMNIKEIIAESLGSVCLDENLGNLNTLAVNADVKNSLINLVRNKKWNLTTHSEYELIRKGDTSASVAEAIKKAKIVASKPFTTILIATADSGALLYDPTGEFKGNVKHTQLSDMVVSTSSRAHETRIRDIDLQGPYNIYVIYTDEGTRNQRQALNNPVSPPNIQQRLDAFKREKGMTINLNDKPSKLIKNLIDMTTIIHKARYYESTKVVIGRDEFEVKSVEDYHRLTSNLRIREIIEGEVLLQTFIATDFTHEDGTNDFRENRVSIYYDFDNQKARLDIKPN